MMNKEIGIMIADKLSESFSDVLYTDMMQDIQEYILHVMQNDSADSIEEIYMEQGNNQDNTFSMHISFVVNADVENYSEELKEAVAEIWDLEADGIELDASLELNMAERGTGTILWQRGRFK